MYSAGEITANNYTTENESNIYKFVIYKGEITSEKFILLLLPPPNRRAPSIYNLLELLFYNIISCDGGGSQLHAFILCCCLSVNQLINKCK